MRAKRIEAAAFLALAAAAMWDGLNLASRAAQQRLALQAGGFIFVLGALLAILVALYLVRDRSGEGDRGFDWRVQRGPLRVAAATGILAVYVFTMPYLGYMVGTALMIVAYLRLFSPYRWVATVAISGSFAVGTAYLWVSVAIMLPQGFLPWP